MLQLGAFRRGVPLPGLRGRYLVQEFSTGSTCDGRGGGIRRAGETAPRCTESVTWRQNSRRTNRRKTWIPTWPLRPSWRKRSQPRTWDVSGTIAAPAHGMPADRRHGEPGRRGNDRRQNEERIRRRSATDTRRCTQIDRTEPSTSGSHSHPGMEGIAAQYQNIYVHRRVSAADLRIILPGPFHAEGKIPTSDRAVIRTSHPHAPARGGRARRPGRPADPNGARGSADRAGDRWRCDSAIRRQALRPNPAPANTPAENPHRTGFRQPHKAAR